jgi:hypothetical protein
MVQGRKISTEIHWIFIHLSTVLSPENILIYTSYSLSSVKQVLKYFKENNVVEEKGEDKEQRKRQAGKLRDINMEVCIYKLHYLC